MAKDIINFDDSVKHTQVNYRSDYPKKDGTRCTFGNVPTELHAEVLALAEASNLTVAQTIAALYEMYLETEDVFQKELKAARAVTGKKRRK